MRTLAFFAALVLAGSSLSCSSSSSNSNAGDTATMDIGPEGNSIVVGGATVTIPPKALALKRTITITVTDQGAPPGYVLLSRFIKCEPSGTDFAQPVQMQMPFHDDMQPGITVFWSANAQPQFTDVGGTKNGDGTMTANVMHFSSGFVGRKQ
jgi:hypothetical protein